MALEQLAAVRRAIRAAPADPEAWFALLAPDVRVDARELGRPDLAEPVEGIDAVRDFFRTWAGAFEEWTPYPEVIVDAGPKVVVSLLQSGRGRTSGVAVEDRHHDVWSFGEDGLATEIRVFRDRAAALEAAGLGSPTGADLAQGLMDALNRWDADAWIALATRDMVFTSTVLAQVEGATFHGHDGVRKYMRQLEEGLGRPHYVAEEVLESGGRVYGRARISASGPRSGATLEVSVGILATVRDGLISRLDAYPDPDEGLRAFGIEP